MALDQNYFDSLSLELIRRKFYNAEKVRSVLFDIQSQATALTEENKTLREKLSGYESGEKDISDAILSATSVARSLVSDAREKADQLLAEAQAEADRLLNEAQIEADRLLNEAKEKSGAMMSEAEAEKAEILAGVEDRTELIVRSMEESYLRMKSRLESCIEGLNEDWQNFLCSLDDGNVSVPAPAAAEEFSEELPEESPEGDLQAEFSEELHQDIRKKLDAIVAELESIGSEE